MSTSLLYHGFGVVGYRYLRTEYREGNVIFTVSRKKFTKTLEEHFDGILAYFDFDCLSTGPLEGTNNKIKTMQRKAYGYRDMEFFKLKLMALHETKYALVG